tara:strand:- start:229 stop:951 length:723 start_codon:yes stop_codon:yes gene_type:complete
MNKFFCNKPYVNIYEQPKINSNISSQIIYGESFKVLKRRRNFLKIKTSYDKYVGYIKNNNFSKKIYTTHKIKVLKAKIYNSKKFLPFSSKIEILKETKNYIMFEKNKWIKKNDIIQLKTKNKEFKEIFKLFLKCGYKWGGKTYDGIDCSALIQLYYKFNNKFFPRDTVDQIKLKKGSNYKKMYRKGDLIFWKGHVAVCLNSKNLIHAYGPKKKVVIMSIKKTIELIKKTANLKVKKIFPI